MIFQLIKAKYTKHNNASANTDLLFAKGELLPIFREQHTTAATTTMITAVCFHKTLITTKCKFTSVILSNSKNKYPTSLKVGPTHTLSLSLYSLKT